MAYLYRHVRLDTNKVFYVGIGSDLNYRRSRVKNNRSKYWKDIVNKSDYRIDILLDDLTWEEACEKEIEFIKLYGRSNVSYGTLCNLTDGGDGMLGYKHSNEWIKELSKRRKSFRYSDESKEKMSISRKSWSYTDEYKINLSKRMSGKNHFMFGKKHKQETKDKISKSHIGKTMDSISRGLNPRAKVVLDLYTGVYFDCGKDCAESYGISYYVFKHMMRRSFEKRILPLIYV
jgi:hypothetical protein